MKINQFDDFNKFDDMNIYNLDDQEVEGIQIELEETGGNLQQDNLNDFDDD